MLLNKHDITINKLEQGNSCTVKDIPARSHYLGNKPQELVKQNSKQENISGSNPNSKVIHGPQYKLRRSFSLLPLMKSKPPQSPTGALTEQECALKINNTTFYSCPVCTQTFPNFSEIQEHMLTHSSTIKKYECDICHKSFSSKRYLMRHKEGHSEKRPFKCDICDKTFKRKAEVVKHKTMHTGEKQHYCDVCDYGTQHKTQLTYHKNSLHKQVLHYVCNICGKDCSSPQALKHHKLTHGEKQFKCKHCDKTFHIKSSCIVHEKQHSPNRIQFQCEICGNKFTSMGGLKKHKLHIHLGEKRKLYQCEFCEKTLTSLGSLKVHRRKHTGDQPFSCDICDKAFSAKNYLTAHKRVHTGEKPFTCHLCDKSYTQQGTLSIHMRSHTGVEPYECGTCFNVFGTKTLLKTHIKSHM